MLQVSLALAGLLLLVRFGGPALIFGATGPGPFGNNWVLADRTATLLLDADLRFFGAMLIGTGLVFFWTILKLDAEAMGTVIYILAAAVAGGAAARIYARVTYGNPGTAGTVALIFESVIPILLVFFQYRVAKRGQRAPFAER
jgi:hypothetical protein